ncbi:PAP2 superfamily protein [Clostridium homopropionicum DSM 5847]|uniref:PAP2 superfamily protein n=1 Tax=Clostridium homopropionicum DSM 5847 TaxID=1121318 RepID=A0A0L6ZEV7_9CLOT|nr:phosphatase PAP2 family protein [Clostridium homopropionicum]KOA21510.1 PAP2 superfamily protein [Clostridium homopropionicum DSM 5847]SFG07328.1 PAP2 superfamily protein [Clostridium homopropionicum]
MKKLKETYIPLLFMLTIPISNIFYKILNTSERGVYSLSTEFDSKIPFIKEFIIPYIIWYPFIFIFMIYICFKDKKAYYRTLISLNLGLIICYVIFYFYQTTVIRPEVAGNDIFSSIVKIIYNNDNPYNCFPSVHVITTFIVMKGVQIATDNKLILKLVNIIGILIIISTQFVKQHVILDLLSGIILGETVFAISMLGIYREGVLWKKKQFSWSMMKKKLEG